MLSRQEELSGTSGTNQRRRAQGHEGSERRLKKGKIGEGERGKKVCEEESGMWELRKEECKGCSGLSQAYPGLCWWFTVQVCLYMQ